MDYEMTPLVEDILVKKVISIHYFEYTKDFIFTGESHDFWEFVYVDRGEIDVRAGDRWIRLTRGEIIFHQPGEFHNVRANGIIAPNIIIVSFDCRSKPMQFFRNRIMLLQDSERQLLATILREATYAFSSPLGDPFLLKLEPRPEPLAFGAEQMIKTSLEQLLISLSRSHAMKKTTTTVLRQNLDKDIVETTVGYLRDHLGSPLCFDDVVQYVSVSRTSLKNAFKERMGTGIMSYFNQMRIERAKLFIREDNYNFTQIAALLGYDSIHHFSRQFKRVTGMSPSEYARSVKIDMDPPPMIYHAAEPVCPPASDAPTEQAE